MSAPSPISRLTLTSPSDAKVTPLEVLSDFADATTGWTYLAEDSSHYAERKERPALVLRHRRGIAPAYVDFAFAADPDAADTVGLVVLDAPDAAEPMPAADRAELVETMVTALRDYLQDRPTTVSLGVERAA